MKFKNLHITVELLEYELDEMATPKAPEVVLKGSRIFLNEQTEPAIAATKYLAMHMGIELTDKDGEVIK